MDKLKEHSFALSLVAVCGVVCALGYFLIFRPIQEIGELNGDVGKQVNTFKRRERQTEPIPTAERLQFLEERKEKEAEELIDALGFYEERAVQFQKYFGEGTSPLLLGDFAGKYKDAEERLLGVYRSTFETGHIEDGDDNTDVPRILGMPRDGGPQFQQNDVPRLMKQFWIIDAVLRACQQLKLGGLKELNFTALQSSGRSTRTRAEAAASAKYPFLVSHVPVSVKIEIRFGDIENLLVALFNDPNVRFLDAPVDQPLIRYTKSSSTLERFERAILKPEKKEQDKPYKEIVPEPTVEVTLNLRALDWQGLRPPPEDEAGG